MNICQANISVQIKFVNVFGIGKFEKNKFRLTGIPFKIKELVASSNYVPTIYVCLETKLKSFHKQIKLPRGTKYIGETSNDDGCGGIFCFMDNNLSIENRQNDVKVIVSKHALYFKIKVENQFLDLIAVYLPTERNEALSVIKEIDRFISDKNLTDFALFGDLNIDFSKPLHRARAIALSSFLKKHRLFDLADKLNTNPSYTWRGRGQRMTSMSYIDHFYCNFDLFKTIDFSHNSFSDHKTVSVATKKKFEYHAPSWKPFLFNDPNFIDLMKIETVNFLKRSVDSQSIQEIENYSKEHFEAIDNDFTYENFEYKETDVIFKLVQHLKSIHDSYYSKIRMKNFNKITRFDKQLSLLLEQFDLNQNIEIKQQIKQLILQQQEYFKDLVHSRAETYFIRNLLVDGHPNRLTFQNFKASRSRDYSLLIDGVLTSDPEKIANTFGEMYAKLASPPSVKKSNLDLLLRKYELDLNDIFPKIKTITSPICSTKEFKDVIKSMKTQSAPGPTSQPKALFSYLFDILPKFSTAAFNKLFLINIEDSPFSFLKKRKFCGIHKKDTDPHIKENYRPISLLEVSYKILSKALNKKITPYLNKICHSDQFGFIPKKHMATASISITALMNYIKSKNTDAQLIFFDLKQAFDKTLYEVSDRIIKHIFPEGNFAEAWCNLTNGGNFYAVVNGHNSQSFTLKQGFGQGDPSSGSKFDIYMHLFIACLKSPKLRHLTLSIKEKPLPSIAFADDSMQAFNLSTEQDITLVENLLQDIFHYVGMEINFKKTKILLYGKCPKNISKLGVISNSVKHLGIYLSFDENLGQELTYNELISKLKAKSQKLCFHAGSNIFKRRNICFSLMNSMAFHIFRVYSINQHQEKKIWKIISKFLWSIKKQNGNTYRFLVAQKRVELSFSQGGLNMLLPKNQCFSVWQTGFFNVLKHAYHYPNSVLGLILSFKHVPLNSMMIDFGSKDMKKYQNSFKSLYPQINTDIFSDSLQYLQKLEKDKATFLFSSITSSVWSQNLRFIRNDISALRKGNLFTIASILETRNIGNKVLYLPLIKNELHIVLADTPLLLTKLKFLVDIIALDFPQLDCYSSRVAKSFLKPIITQSIKAPSIFALYFKSMHRKSIESPHPSIRTRLQSGKYFPDSQAFFSSFDKILSSPIGLYYKSFFFQQFTRTLTSRNKLFKFGHLESDKCIKCNVVADTEHAIYECSFPKYFSHCLAMFLDKHYNEGAPDFLFLKENFFLFNIYYESFTYMEYIQITQLILTAKDKALKFNNDTCLVKWNAYNYFAQSLLIAQFSSRLLSNTGINTCLIDEFIDFLLMYSDNVTFFNR